MSLNAIASRLGVAKSSVSRWVGDIELRPEQHAALQRLNPIYNAQLRGQGTRRATARARRLAAQEHGRAHAHRGDSLHLAGCMLYWAEGAKCRNAVIFTNSDADMVELFLRFLRRCYDVPVEAIALSVNCHVAPGHDAAAITQWWLDRLALPRRVPAPRRSINRRRRRAGVAATFCPTARRGSPCTRRSSSRASSARSRSTPAPRGRSGST
jgi:hypothetical protein